MRKVSISLMILVIFVFDSCSAKQKGYSAALSQKEAPSAVVYDDSEFFDWIQKVESGEIEPEPPIDVEEKWAPPEIEIPAGSILEIKDKLFLTQINDIYFNYESYKDKTIIVEGMFTYFVSYLDDSEVPAVFRFGPGCCGNDGWGGFLLDWKGTYPEDNDWIKVTGKPVIKTTGGYQDLFLEVMSIEIKAERGNEYVSN